jgi:hypothetical protein
MPVVADFLKGTVSENLTKVVQPAGLVPATILVLLNLGFLYPAALADGVPVAKAFGGLKEQWQVVVLAALILAIGYLLLHAANWIIAVLAGQTWRASGLNWLLRSWQLRQRIQLKRRLDSARKAENRAALRWELATRFPTIDPPQRYIQPTRLGNSLVATQHIIRDRYGIDITALWSQMESVEGVKDAPALTAVKDEKVTLDLLANLVFVLAIFAVQAVVYFGYRERWDDVLIALLVLPLAYVTYRVADTSARSWGNAVEVTLDLHREKLREELGLRKETDAADERELWEKASAFYLPGSEEEPAADLFKTVSPPRAAVTKAPSLEVETVTAAVVNRVVDGTSSEVERVFTLRSVEYLLIVSRKDEAARWAAADFVIDDPRVARVAAEPEAVREGAIEAKSRIRSSDDGSRLQWRVTGLQQGASLTLGYHLPLWRLIVAGATGEVNVRAQKDGYRLSIPGAAGRTVKLTLERYSPRLALPAVQLGRKPVDLTPAGQGFESDEIKIPAENPSFWITLPAEEA